MESNKWLGTMTTDFSVTASEAWAIAGDFFGLPKWIPMDSCSKLEGEDNKPGCIRFNKLGINWAKERLVAFDPIGHSYTYEIIESNMGFGCYLGIIKVIPAGEEGCKVVWSVEADPIQGWNKDDFIPWMQTLFKGLENAINNIK